MSAPCPDATPAHWPDGLNARRLPDTALAQAYDGTPAPLRGCVKTCLALGYAQHGERPETAEQMIRDAATVFVRHVRRTPAPWTVVAFTREYASAPRLAAALLPPLLAHVPLLGAVCVGGSPTAAAALALELAGVEDAFVLDRDDIPPLLEHLNGYGAGRLVLLHDGALAPLRAVAQELRLPLWEESRPPRLLAVEHGGHRQDWLDWAHPDAPREGVVSSGDGSLSAPSRADALFCAPGQQAQALGYAPLALTPGLEGCWLHPELSPDFFMRTALACGLVDI